MPDLPCTPRRRASNAGALACALATFASLVATACTGTADAPPLGSEAYLFPEGQVRHAARLQQIDQRIDAAQGQAAAQPTAWSPLEAEAGHWAARASLRGGVADYVQADLAMQRAFERAPLGGGPWLRAANLAFTLHRLDEASAALDVAAGAALVDDPTRAAIEGLRGDIALQRGEMQEAHALLQAAEQLHPTSRSAARLGLWAWRTGELDAADEQYALAQSRYHGQEPDTRAWFHLQLGLIDLDRGAYDDAMAHYLDANAQLSGYFLIEEHVAEVLVRQGRVNEARFVYEDVVARTGAPEFMDALASLHADAGDEDQAKAWAARATQAYEAQLVALPEAATGHALDHFLSFGAPSRAVELAQFNFELRSNPQSESSLALALALDGHPELAREHIDQAQAGGWRSFDLDAEAAEIYDLLGDSAAATGARERACAEVILRCAELDAP